MRLLLVAVLAGLVCFTHGVNQNDGFTDDEWKQCLKTVPKRAVKVTFVGNTTIDESNQGTIVSAQKSAVQPDLAYFHIYGKLYAIFMYCVDEEGCVEKVPILWFVDNLTSGTAEGGEVQKPYTPPPGNVSKPSRCVIVVAVQSGKISSTSSTTTKLPVVGQLLNSLDRVFIPEFLTKFGLEVTAASSFTTEKLVPS